MTVTSEWRPSRVRGLPATGVKKVRRRQANLHLFTYVVGNALAWILWAAISISADHWYWWALIPLLGWAIVLGIDFALTQKEGRRRT